MSLDDDDDLDEENIPGYSLATPQPTDKGKSRAREFEQLAPPSSETNGEASNPLSGNIGSSAGYAARAPTRQTVGGVQVETRYAMQQVMCFI